MVTHTWSNGRLRCYDGRPVVEENRSKANETQVGGKHYQGAAIQHWDIVAMHNLDYFQGQITKYVMRWKMKNGVEDLKKAQHFLQKYIELQETAVK